MQELVEQNFKPHPLDWVVEELRDQPSYLEKPMFGCRACYLMGELKLVLASADEEPWNGVLVATSKEHHESLRREIAALAPHPVLGKWLYLSEQDEDFERLSGQVIRLILRADTRIGVPPSSKRSSGKRKSKKAARDREK